VTTADGTVLGTTKILDNGTPARRWNLVIMGDGYQPGQLAQYAADAQQLVATLVVTPPFDSLRAAINVYRVDVTSTNSGADDPVACGGSGATANTYFDASFCTNGIRRLLVANTGTAFAVANAQVPQWHMIMVIVNSTVYGGSGGSIAVYSLAPGAVEIALHEMGHTAFGLADEYEYYAGCGVDTDRDNHPNVEPAEPNVTTDTNRSTIKWRDLVLPSTPLPTTTNPDCTQCDPRTGPPPPLPTDVVGAFEGAHYYHCGAFRPQFHCRMRALNNPFCAVCQRRIQSTLTPFLPPNIELGAGQTQPGLGWQQYPGGAGIYLDVNTTSGHFSSTPVYLTSLGGTSSHWATTGATSLYSPTPTGFRVYVRWADGSPLTPANAAALGWNLNWIGMNT
jgi:IgA peptidase M64